MSSYHSSCSSYLAGNDWSMFKHCGSLLSDWIVTFHVLSQHGHQNISKRQASIPTSHSPSATVSSIVTWCRPIVHERPIKLPPTWLDPLLPPPEPGPELTNSRRDESKNFLIIVMSDLDDQDKLSSLQYRLLKCPCLQLCQFHKCMYCASFTNLVFLDKAEGLSDTASLVCRCQNSCDFFTSTGSS